MDFERFELKVLEVFKASKRLKNARKAFAIS